MDQKKIAPFYLLITALLWCFNGVLTKYIPWSAFTTAVIRGTTTFICICLVRRCKIWKIRMNRYKFLCSLCYLLQGLLFFLALKSTTAANATVLQNTSPLYIMLLNAILLKKYPQKQDVLACVALLIGVGITFAGSLETGGTLGNCLALIGALFYAGVFFFSKEEGANPLESLFLGNACYLLLLPVVLTNETVLATTLPDWGFLILFATMTGIGAWLCFAVGIKHTSALQANFITMSEPVMAPVWTFLFLRETISPMSVAGCVIVIATLLIYNISASKKER
jgi:drug/metabolite transporter (DMT)-like permease